MRKRRTELCFFACWGHHAFFILKNGTLKGYGHNSYGQLSTGDNLQKNKPVTIKGFLEGSRKEISDISTGYYHSLLLTKADGVYVCGINSNGEVGIGKTKDEIKEVKLAVATVNEILKEQGMKVQAAQAGQHCSYFICQGGVVFSSGKNEHGQLGIGKRPSVSLGSYYKRNVMRSENSPQKIETLRNIVKIVTGCEWAIFISKSNKFYGCGKNDHNQLCLGVRHLVDQTVPVQITYFSDLRIKIQQVLTTFTTSYFKTYSGEMYVVGNTKYGEFGSTIDPIVQKVKKPVISNALKNIDLTWKGVSYCYLAFKREGKIYGCGYNARYYVGCDNRPGSGNYQEIVEVSPLRGKEVVQIHTSWGNTMYVCSNGDVYSTGDSYKLMPVGNDYDKMRTENGVVLVLKGLDLKSRKLASGDEERLERLLFLREKKQMWEVFHLFFK